MRVYVKDENHEELSVDDLIYGSRVKYSVCKFIVEEIYSMDTEELAAYKEYHSRNVTDLS